MLTDVPRIVTGETKFVDYPEVKEVADKLGATTAQVLVAWGAHRGYSVIPKSVNKGTPTVLRSVLIIVNALAARSHHLQL